MRKNVYVKGHVIDPENVLIEMLYVVIDFSCRKVVSVETHKVENGILSVSGPVPTDVDADPYFDVIRRNGYNFVFGEDF